MGRRFPLGVVKRLQLDRGGGCTEAAVKVLSTPEL